MISGWSFIEQAFTSCCAKTYQRIAMIGFKISYKPFEKWFNTFISLAYKFSSSHMLLTRAFVKSIKPPAFPLEIVLEKQPYVWTNTSRTWKAKCASRGWPKLEKSFERNSLCFNTLFLTDLKVNSVGFFTSAIVSYFLYATKFFVSFFSKKYFCFLFFNLSRLCIVQHGHTLYLEKHNEIPMLDLNPFIIKIWCKRRIIIGNRTNDTRLWFVTTYINHTKFWSKIMGWHIAKWACIFDFIWAIGDS